MARGKGVPLFRMSLITEDECDERTESEDSQEEDSDSSGEGLVLPAITVPLGCSGQEGGPAGDSMGSTPVKSRLNVVDKNPDQKGSGTRTACSLQVPANKIRTALMMRGSVRRRASVMHFAGTVLSSSMVSI